MTSNEPAPEALITVDFETRFPHHYWISTWATDEQYPKGFRYKILSVRPEPDGLFELVVVLEQRGGLKTEMENLSISPSAFERTAKIFVDGLADSYGIKFEMLDTSSCRSAEEFDRVVTRAGWNEWR